MKNKKILYLFAFFVLVIHVVYSQSVCAFCEKLKNNVVRITSTFSDGREENGFGTVIAERNNKLYIVTAKHVVYTLDDKGLLVMITVQKLL